MADYQWNPLKDENKFEDLVNDLCSKKYGIEFQIYGRKGQKQYGIDGSALTKDNKHILHQCKNKMISRRDKAIQSELLKDLETETNAMIKEFIDGKGYTLDRFILANSFKRDTKLQDKATELSVTYDIVVIVWSWDEISDMLEEYTVIAQKYYPQSFNKISNTKLFPQLTINLGKSTLIGREKELQEIDEQLKASKTLLVKGIGGVGKSTIASNYLHHHKDEYDYYGFFEGLESFESQLELAFKLEIEQGQDRLNRVLRELIKLDGNKLLVIDKVEEIKENQEKLEKILGLEHNGYRVLLTSRFKVKNVKIYPLPTLDQLDAQKLFLDNFTTEELEKVNKITEYLDYHPLFVELVATTIATMDYTLDEILKKFDYGELAEIKLIDDDGDEVSFNQNLQKLFEMQRESLKDEYLLFLKQLAVLPSIDIELNFSNKIFDRRLNGQWNFLLKQGWLIKSENGYKLHEIIKRYLLLPENAPSLKDIETIVEYFYKYTSKDDIWIVYIESIAEFLEKSHFRDEKVSKLYFEIAYLFYEKFGNYKKARKYFMLNKEIIEEQGLESIEVSYKFLAFVTGKLEDLEESYTYISKALKIFEKNNDKRSIAICDDILGGIYWKKQELEQSEIFYKKALDFYLPTTNVTQKAIIYNNISLIYKDKEDYSKSHELLEKAIELDIDDKKEVAQFYNNRGELYIEEREYELAKKDILFAFKMREDLKLYEYHDYFAESYDNLAIIYFERGEYKESKIEQDKAIEIWSYNHDDNYGYLVDARERLVLIAKEL